MSRRGGSPQDFDRIENLINELRPRYAERDNLQNSLEQQARSGKPANPATTERIRELDNEIRQRQLQLLAPRVDDLPEPRTVDPGPPGFFERGDPDD